MNRRLLTPTLIVGALLVVVGTQFLFPGAGETGTATPQISWSPTSLVVTLTPGETKTLQVKATINSLVPSAAVDLSPGLVPYVSVTPSKLPALPHGGFQTFQLFVAVPSSTQFETIIGTLALRAGSQPIAKSLSLTLNVWQSSQITAGNDVVKLNYPPGWQLNQEPDGRLSFDDPSLSQTCPSEDQTCNQEDPPELTFALIPNTGNLTLTDFLSTYHDGWYSDYRTVTYSTLKGRAAVFASDKSEVPPRTPRFAAFVQFPQSIGILTANDEAQEQSFMNMLQTLTLL